MREAMSRETACDLSPWRIAMIEPRSVAAVTIQKITEEEKKT